MPKPLFNPLLNKQMTRKEFLKFWGTLIVAMIPIIAVLKKLEDSFAASPYVEKEAEGGTISGEAAVVSSSAASGGEYVQFGSASTGGNGVVTVAQPTVSGGSPTVRGQGYGWYHPTTGLIYYFGGNTSNYAPLSDTWSFNPSTNVWHQITSANQPPTNIAVTIGYDPITGHLIMFGGDNGNIWYNTTWSMDPTISNPVWTQLFPSNSPATRSGHSVWNDPVTGDMLIYGGNQGGNPNCFDDLWKWTGSNWVEVSSALTGTGRTGAFTGTLSNGTTVIFGGFAGGVLNDTYTWNGTTCTKKTPATSPPARGFGGGAPTSDGRFLIYGGANRDSTVNSTDCWTWDGTNWTKQTPTGVNMQGLSSQAMNYHPPTQKIVSAFGTQGPSANTSPLGDINTVYEITV